MTMYPSKIRAELDSMPSGHLKVGDRVCFGWPTGAGMKVYEVLEVLPPSTILDTRVCNHKGETLWFRSLGAKVVTRKVVA